MERKIDPHRGVLSTRVTYGLGGRVGMGVARCGVRPVYLALAIAIAIVKMVQRMRAQIMFKV